MPTAVGAHLFLLGLACGVALLTATSYRRVSPPWLRWLLVASAMLVLSWYALITLQVLPEAPISSGWVRAGWYAGAIGFTLPAFFAIDQLLKHPAMTPAKLLRWYVPFFALYGLVTCFADLALMERLFAVIHSLFGAAILAVGLLLLRRVPAGAIRNALLLLMAAYVSFAGEAVVRAFLLSDGFRYLELLVLLALWHAYETSAKLQ